MYLIVDNPIQLLGINSQYLLLHVKHLLRGLPPARPLFATNRAFNGALLHRSPPLDITKPKNHENGITTNLHLVRHIPPLPDLLVRRHLVHVCLIVGAHVLEGRKQDTCCVVEEYRVCTFALSALDINHQ